MSDNRLSRSAFQPSDARSLGCLRRRSAHLRWGVILLAAAERRLGIVERLAALINDPAIRQFVTHGVADILRARILAIACVTRAPTTSIICAAIPASSLPAGACPIPGATCAHSRPCHAGRMPSVREVIRMTYAIVDVYCASYARPPAAVTLDLDDTVDVVHGHQQMSLFKGHYEERCLGRSMSTIVPARAR